MLLPPELSRARPEDARDDTAWPDDELGRLLLRARPAERRALDDTWCSPDDEACRRCMDTKHKHVRSTRSQKASLGQEVEEDDRIETETDRLRETEKDLGV